MEAIKPEEVAEQLRKVISGEAQIRLADPNLTWDTVWCGNCEVVIGDWRIVFFNDCGELDYTDHVTAPDGREADFDQFYESSDPVELLSDQDRGYLETILETAK